MRASHTQSASIAWTQKEYSTVNEHRVKTRLAACLELLTPKSDQETLRATVLRENRFAVAERVELIGFEPTTSGLQSPRSPS